MHSDIKTPYRYFAAANGYLGFRSYFGEIFDSKDYDRIFVIKGGPGTGKSTFMKMAANYFFDKGCYVEAIYCSSDINSLDGTLIEKNGARVALIDATAPHERDAKIPGAIDTILNLGEGFDEAALENQRLHILKLNQEKKSSYDSAYSYLSIIGNIDRKIRADYEKNNSCTEISEKAKDLAKANLPPSCQGKKRRLTSSFSKDGYSTLNTLSTLADSIITIKGDGVSEYIFMRALLEEANLIGAAYTVAPSPFCDDITEELYFPDASLTVSTRGSLSKVIDTVPHSSMASTSANAALQDMKRKLLALAKDAFAEASRYHFELEKIYTAAMDFEKNFVIYSKTSERICEILRL